MASRAKRGPAAGGRRSAAAARARGAPVAPRSRAARPRATAKRRTSVDLRWGRLALLVLLIAGAAFYVAPLRDFFAQQNRYQREVATLGQEKRQNAQLKLQLAMLNSRAYITQRARSDFQLVVPGTQAFIVLGLPGDQSAAQRKDGQNQSASLSPLDRLRDLWRTLLH